MFKHVHLRVEFSVRKICLILVVQVLPNLLLLEHGNDSLVVLDLSLIVLLKWLNKSYLVNRSFLVSLWGSDYHALAVDICTTVHLLHYSDWLISPDADCRLVIAVEARLAIFFDSEW